MKPEKIPERKVCLIQAPAQADQGSRQGQTIA